MKACSDCGEVKPLEAYALNRGGSPRARCRVCNSALDRERRAARLEESRAQKRRWYAEHRAEHKARVMAWRATNREKDRAIGRNAQAKRRALLRECAVIENVKYEVLYERDRGRCQLCRRRIGITVGTIDHVIPISKGGDHTYANTQLACGPCNFSKGNRSRGEQLALI